VVPGPSVLFTVGRALALGRRAGVATVMGNTLERKGLARIVADGFLVGVGNPKVVVFLAAVLPQFVDRAAGQVPGQLLVLGALFAAIALVCDCCWALAAGTARAWFGRSPRRLELIGGTGGLVMIGLGVTLAVTGRKD
jgi:threonine/homoserine/homoserine lactone efflux protein